MLIYISIQWHYDNQAHGWEIRLQGIAASPVN